MLAFISSTTYLLPSFVRERTGWYNINVCILHRMHFLQASQVSSTAQLRLNDLTSTVIGLLPPYTSHILSLKQLFLLSDYLVLPAASDYRVVELPISVFSSGTISSPTPPSTKAFKFPNACSSLILHDSADSPPIWGKSVHRGNVNKRGSTRGSSGYTSKPTDES